LIPVHFVEVWMTNKIPTDGAYRGLSQSGLKKILLVDDSVTMQKVVQMTFSAEPFAVTTVSSAAETIARAREMRPDIVIADLSMPGRNGYDICAEIKADPLLGGVPVLLLHGSAAVYDEAKAKVVKADGEITKPFESQVCIDKVKAMIAAKPVVAPPPVARSPMGPVKSLAPPITAEVEDVVIDTGAIGATPTPPHAPVTPALSRPNIPLIKPSAAPPMPALAPTAPITSVKAPPPPTTKPITRPGISAASPAPAMAGMPQPAMPGGAVNKPPTGTKPAVQLQEVEITIEAEPPTDEAQEAFPSFEIVQASPEKSRERSDATMLGVGKPELPPPPAGMALPSAGMPPPPAGMPLPPLAVPAISIPSTPSTVAAPHTRPQPTILRGEGIDPAVYEAIVQLSREVIEKVVWEIVPDLAEKIIRQELDRLVEKQRL
jgi:CheY-like chemotaxis protein